MGRLVVQQFVSADTFAADDAGEMSFMSAVEGDTSEFDRRNAAWLETTGAIVLGAATYRMFVEYWPTPQSEHEVVAPRINALPKHVLSSTLEAAPWGDHEPAFVEPGDAGETVARLKADYAGDLICWGSLSLSHALFAAGAVDEVRLVTMPMAIGSGRGPFPAGLVRLELTASERIGPVVASSYDVLR